jgi:hypothetical protein
MKTGDRIRLRKDMADKMKSPQLTGVISGMAGDYAVITWDDGGSANLPVLWLEPVK